MIEFNRMSVVGNEEKYLLEALYSGKWCGRGPKTIELEKLAKQLCQVNHAFFVTSCSSALEIGTLLAKIGPGDEVIMPSFGFVSAANAIVTRGGRPVFSDIDAKTWNTSLEFVEPLVTKKTKAIIPVHYGGSTAGIEELRSFCKEKRIFLIEDAAQSLGCRRDDKPIGSTPWVTCFSLHDTKNVSSGEGGFIMTDSDELALQIEIQIEKGTNRQKFFRGHVDKYTWVDRGSSYIASDLLAAVGLGQLEQLEKVTKKRRLICAKYREEIGDFGGKINWQFIPQGIETNGHVGAFHVDPKLRTKVIYEFKKVGVGAVFHYVSLHDSPFAKENGFAPAKDLIQTRNISEGLVRLPVFFSMTEQEIDEVISKARSILSTI